MNKIKKSTMNNVKSNLNISDIHFTLVDDSSYLKAYCSIVINNSIYINGIQLISANDGYFINMPSKRAKNGNFVPMMHILNNDDKKIITEKIINKYFGLINKLKERDTVIV